MASDGPTQTTTINYHGNQHQISSDIIIVFMKKNNGNMNLRLPLLQSSAPDFMKNPFHFS
jgi:hypothetical protein